MSDGETFAAPVNGWTVTPKEQVTDEEPPAPVCKGCGRPVHLCVCE